MKRWKERIQWRKPLMFCSSKNNSIQLQFFGATALSLFTAASSLNCSFLGGFSGKTALARLSVEAYTWHAVRVCTCCCSWDPSDEPGENSGRRRTAGREPECVTSAPQVSSACTHSGLDSKTRQWNNVRAVEVRLKCVRHLLHSRLTLTDFSQCLATEKKFNCRHISPRRFQNEVIKSKFYRAVFFDAYCVMVNGNCHFYLRCLRLPRLKSFVMFSWWVYCLQWPLASRWKRLRLLPSSWLRSCPTQLTRGKSAYASVPVCRPEQSRK